MKISMTCDKQRVEKLISVIWNEEPGDMTQVMKPDWNLIDLIIFLIIFIKVCWKRREEQSDSELDCG